MAVNEFGFDKSATYVIARRAYEYALQGAHDSAATLLEGLMAADPADRYAAVTLAAVRLKQDRAEDASALLEAILRREPRDEEASGLLVEAHLAVGRVAGAEGLIGEMRAAGMEVSERLRLRLEAAKNGGGVRQLEA